MATTELIEATPRAHESRGKNEARRVRATGRIPAIVYGAKKDSISVTVNPKQITKILQSATGHNTIFDLKVGSAQDKVMIVDWQFDPIKDSLLHKNHGIFRISVNGQVVADSLDLCHSRGHFLEFEFKNVELRKGANVLEFVVVGKNPHSKEWTPGNGYYKLGFDYLRLR